MDMRVETSVSTSVDANWWILMRSWKPIIHIAAGEKYTEY